MALQALISSWLPFGPAWHCNPVLANIFMANRTRWEIFKFEFSRFGRFASLPRQMRNIKLRCYTLRWDGWGGVVTGRRCRICWMPYSESSYPVISDSRTNEGVCAAIQKIITRGTHHLSTLLWSPLLLLTQDWPGQLSFVDFPRIVWRWCLLLAGRSLTKIESVACQIWTSLGQLTIFPATHLLSWSEGGHQDLLRAWPATSQAARPVNGTFPSFYGRSIPRSWSK